MIKRLLLFMLFAAPLWAQVTVSPLVMPRKQFLDQAGKPLANGHVCTYTVGTTTPQVTYTDFTGGTTNPICDPIPTPPIGGIVLDAGGRASIYIDCTLPPLKVVVYDKNGVLQWSEDGVQYPGTCVRQPASCPPGEFITSINSDGSVTCALGGGGGLTSGDILNTMTNRWASIVWSCTTPIGSESSEGVFADWAISAPTSRTCNDATYKFPYNTWTTSTAASNSHDASTDDESWDLDSDPQFSIRTSISDKISGFRRWIGWTDTTILGMTSTDNPTTANVIAFWTCQDAGASCNPDSGASTLWCVTKDTTTINRVDTGIAVVQDQIYLLQVKYTSATSTAKFYVDGAEVCSMNADMPAAGTRMRFQSSITNVSGAVTYSMRAHGIFLYSALPVP